MRKDGERHMGFRVDGTLLAKFRHVCEYEGRSATAQLIRLMQNFVAQYERKFGEIQVETTKDE